MAQSTGIVNTTNNTVPLYSTQDVQTLLNVKKQHLQQVESALMEVSILSDACEMFGTQSPIYSTYSSGKSSTRSELLNLKNVLTYEIDNIQKMQQDTKDKEQAKQAKQAAEKKRKEEAEAKLIAEKQAAEKKAKEEEEKKLKDLGGELASSTILTIAQSTRFINEILNDVKKSNSTKLLYRATRDGFSTKSFHSKCDDKGASVLIVKTKSGAIFGAYVGIGWKSGTGSYYYDPTAFLFSLISSTNEQRFTKIAQTGYPNSIYSHPDYGPTFGGTHDLHICSNSNTIAGSFSHLGHTYQAPYGYGNSDYYFAESKFLVSEIEVFSM